MLNGNVCVYVCVCVCVCVCVRVRVRVRVHVLFTFGRQADPVEVAGEFLWHVRFASSRQAHHHDDGGQVGTRCCRGGGWDINHENSACLELQKK